MSPPLMNQWFLCMISKVLGIPSGLYPALVMVDRPTLSASRSFSRVYMRNADCAPAMEPVATAWPMALVVWPPLEPMSAPATTPAMEAMLMKRIWSMRLATWCS